MHYPRLAGAAGPHAQGRQQLDEMGGVGQKMRKMFALWTICSLASLALPPCQSFQCPGQVVAQPVDHHRVAQLA